jgi:hypothetical protein
MTPQLISIAPNGAVTITAIKTQPSAEILQKIVGGWIELVPYFTAYDGVPCIAFCNEEGKLKNLPYNPHATRLWQKAVDGPVDDVLVGTIAIVVADRAFLQRM